ncbi:putative signal transducing protein [Candidatus Latescibacterota bacterium]
MFCPKCRNEKREEFSVCPVCNIPLVMELLPEPKPEYVKFVTVFSAGNPADIVIAKSILENANIQYFAKNEGVQDLIGWGRIGMKYNLAVGPIEIQVGEDDAGEAQALFKELEKSESEDTHSKMMELISTLSDEELYEIIELKSREYFPEAIRIAKEEAVKRGGLKSIIQRINKK